MADDQQEGENTLNELFERFDADSNGLIDESQFHEMLRAIGVDSAEEIESLEFALIDEDGDGLIAFQEFANWWLDRDTEQ